MIGAKRAAMEIEFDVEFEMPVRVVVTSMCPSAKFVACYASEGRVRCKEVIRFVTFALRTLTGCAHGRTLTWGQKQPACYVHTIMTGKLSGYYLCS